MNQLCVSVPVASDTSKILDEVFSMCRIPWIFDFIFKADPAADISMLLAPIQKRYGLAARIFINAIETSSTYAHTFDYNKEFIFYSIPAFSVGPITAGFCVEQPVVRTPIPSQNPAPSPDPSNSSSTTNSLQCIRFVRHDDDGIFFHVSENHNTNITEVDCLTLRSSTRSTRVRMKFDLSSFRSVLNTARGILHPADIASSLIYLNSSNERRSCPVCGGRENAECSCLLPLRRPLHPLDFSYEASNMRLYAGFYQGATVVRLCNAGHCVINATLQSGSVIQGELNAQLIARLHRMAVKNRIAHLKSQSVVKHTPLSLAELSADAQAAVAALESQARAHNAWPETEVDALASRTGDEDGPSDADADADVEAQQAAAAAVANMTAGDTGVDAVIDVASTQITGHANETHALIPVNVKRKDRAEIVPLPNIVDNGVSAVDPNMRLPLETNANTPLNNRDTDSLLDGANLNTLIVNTAETEFLPMEDDNTLADIINEGTELFNNTNPFSRGLSTDGMFSETERLMDSNGVVNEVELPENDSLCLTNDIGGESAGLGEAELHINGLQLHNMNNVSTSPVANIRILSTSSAYASNDDGAAQTCNEQSSSQRVRESEHNVEISTAPRAEGLMNSDPVSTSANIISFYERDIKDRQDITDNVPGQAQKRRRTTTSESCAEDPENIEPAPSDMLTEDERKAEIRKKRNREAAARSNLKRKQHNERIRRDKAQLTQRAVQLRVKEMMLRNENTRLRNQLRASNINFLPS